VPRSNDPVDDAADEDQWPDEYHHIPGAYRATVEHHVRACFERRDHRDPRFDHEFLNGTPEIWEAERKKEQAEEAARIAERDRLAPGMVAELLAAGEPVAVRLHSGPGLPRELWGDRRLQNYSVISITITADDTVIVARRDPRLNYGPFLWSTYGYSAGSFPPDYIRYVGHPDLPPVREIPAGSSGSQRAG
jgi:proteasome lid subunit RPN8/RPN11